MKGDKSLSRLPNNPPKKGTRLISLDNNYT